MQRSAASRRKSPFVEPANRNNMDESYRRVSFATSRLITRTYSTSFSIGVRCLDRRIRHAVYGIYGFVRLADEIVDSFHDFDREALFGEFEAEYDRALARGISLNPVVNAFQETVRRYGIDDALVRAFLRSMRMDLGAGKYPEQTMREYIYGSAEAVGLMCLQVFVDGDRAAFERLAPHARRLGAAFQKVNFLRDLKHDTEQLHRIYFPVLASRPLDELTKQAILDEIYDDFRLAAEGIRRLPRCARLGVYTAYLYYLSLTRAIENTPAERLLDRRIRVSNRRKAYLFGKAYVTSKWPGAW